jgi:hypothetical protein
MCLACDMEAMWFAVMDARAAAGAESAPQPDEPATHHPSPQVDDPLLPPPERGRGGEGVAGGTDETADMRRESEDPHPNPPPEEGGGGASAEFASNGGAPNGGPRQRERVAPPRRFACEETPAE